MNICVKAFSAGVSTGGLGETFIEPGTSEPVTPGTSASIGESDIITPGTSITPGNSDISDETPAIGESQLSPGQSGSVQPAPGSSGQAIPGSSEQSIPGSSNTETVYAHVAKPSEAFLDYLQLIKSGPSLGSADQNGHTFGAIPEPYDYFGDRNITEPSEPLTGGVLPAYYNLNSLGLVSPVKDQDHYGACWTFATMASIESGYLKLNGADLASSVYLRAKSGSSILLFANAANPDTVASYAWSVTEGNTSVSIVPNSATCTVSYTDGGPEAEADIKCVITYDTNSTVEKTFRIAVADYGDGDGSQKAPYQVKSKTQLKLLDCFKGKPSQGLNFTQKNDITLTDYWHPIGDAANPFMGSFNGGGFTINGFKLITLFSFEPAGLFGCVNGGTIENIILCDADIEASPSYFVGECYVGGIAGRAQNSTIQNCAVSGEYGFTLSQDNATEPCVGGLIGDAKDNTVVNHCSFSGSIHMTSTKKITIGGLIGCATNATVSNSFANLNAHGGQNSSFGGLTGLADKANITDCYATGTFSTLDSATGVCAGGITREARNQCSFTNCYTSVNYDKSFTESGSRKGAIAAWCDGTQKLSNCYYDKTAAGDGVVLETFTSAPKGLTAQQMAQQTSFTGFNFTTNWVMAPGPAGYMPVLQNPLGVTSTTKLDNTSFTPPAIYVKDTAVIFGKLNPSYAWPFPIELTPANDTIVSKGASGIVTGLKRGITSVNASYKAYPIASGVEITVYDKKADLDHDGKPDYLNSINALLKWLTGQATPSDDACWLLDADNSCGDNFKADIDGDPNTLPTDCLQLKDLLIMQQANTGIYKNLKNPL